MSRVKAYSKKKDDRMTFAQNFISGGIAGVTSRTITSPLDVVKILAQVGTESTQGGMMATFSRVYSEEGIKAFWKGNGVACLRLFPYSAIQFAAFNRLKLVFSDEDGNLTPVNALFAGSLGGVMATISVYPLDMVKTRLTVQHSGGDAKYLGISHAFKTIAAEEGVGAFYKGLAPSVMGVIPFAGCTFMSYEVLSKVWGKPRSKLGPVEQFLNGCLAGAFAQTFSFPFDTIRKKMQAQSKVATEGMVQADVEFTSMTDCFVKTIKKNGPLGMWRGTTANLAKVAPYAGLMFLAFEASKRVFLYMNGYTISPYKDTPKPEVDQSMRPEELKQWLKNQKA